MFHNIEHRLQAALVTRDKDGGLRLLKAESDLVDFASNDYLGLAKIRSTESYESFGSTGSRLMTGNLAEHEQLESYLADYHQAEGALLFNSGYCANLGIFSCLVGRHDAIFYDELCHASIRDGVRLSLGKGISFRHNNLLDLESKLKLVTAQSKFIAVESIYSMDGDGPDPQELVLLCRKYNASLIVDEAHSLAVFGEKGEGIFQGATLHNDCLVRLYPFGKGVGYHGAVVVCSKIVKQYLINFCRPFIYTTAPPMGMATEIHARYKIMKDSPERNKLHKIISHFKEVFFLLKDQLLPSASPIQSIIIPGNLQVKQVATYLQERGFDIRPILNPTVPVGTERIRISLHSFNTEEQINKLYTCLIAALEEIKKL